MSAAVLRNVSEIATIAQWADDLDDVDIAHVGDESIDALTAGEGPVSFVKSTPRHSTLTVAGDVVTIELDLTIQFADHSSVTVDALLTGNIHGGCAGLVDLSRITSRTV